MPKKKGKATAKQRGKRAKKAKVKLEDLPAEAQLSDEDLEQVRGADGVSTLGTSWGSLPPLKKVTQDPVKYPVCPDGIIKNP